MRIPEKPVWNPDAVLELSPARLRQLLDALLSLNPEKEKLLDH